MSEAALSLEAPAEAVRQHTADNRAREFLLTGGATLVLFPLLFLSGALYPTEGMPAPLRAVARANPVTYAVDLVRHALGQPAETTAPVAAGAVLGVTALAFVLTALLFDPEQRFFPTRPRAQDGS